MSVLTELGKGQAYLKAGFFGFPKAGKTWTAMLLATGLRDFFKLKGPIAFIDSEGGSEYVAGKIKEATGQPLVGLKTRSFDKLIEAGKECERGDVSVMIVDSITHFWNELKAAYCDKVGIRDFRGGIHHIMRIKELWAPWPDFFLTSNLHIITCGRGGFEWDNIEDAEGNLQLVKVGTKMRVETEYGFEPSLLVEMERIRDKAGQPSIHRANCIGDRFGILDGKSCDDPDFSFFLPHVNLLAPHIKMDHVDTTVTSDPDVDDSGQTAWARERNQREVLSEEIMGEIVNVWPGRSAQEQKCKGHVLWAVFGTRSWANISKRTEAQLLKQGLGVMRTILKDPQAIQDLVDRSEAGDVKQAEYMQEPSPPEVIKPAPEEGGVPAEEVELGKYAQKLLNMLFDAAAEAGAKLPDAVDNWLQSIDLTRGDLNDRPSRDVVRDQWATVDWKYYEESHTLA
jgi:hypothetical protein